MEGRNARAEEEVVEGRQPGVVVAGSFRWRHLRAFAAWARPAIRRCIPTFGRPPREGRRPCTPRTNRKAGSSPLDLGNGRSLGCRTPGPCWRNLYAVKLNLPPIYRAAGVQLFLECMIDYCGYGRLLNHPEKVFYLRKVEDQLRLAERLIQVCKSAKPDLPPHASVQKSGAYCCSTLPSANSSVSTRIESR